MNTQKVTAETLNSAIEFDVPFKIIRTLDTGETVIADTNGVYAPIVHLFVDKNGNGVYEEEIDDRPWNDSPYWEAINGYSGQQGYSGPTMHTSEYLGGNMARDVLADIGATYIMSVVECFPNWNATEEEEEEMEIRDNPAGWMLLKLKDSSAK